MIELNEQNTPASFDPASQPAKHQSWFIPAKPYTFIDAFNRRAAATGSPQYASLMEGARCNGHRLSLGWNDFRGYYICEYYWSGRRVVARGASFNWVATLAVREWQQQGLGALLHVGPRPDDKEAILFCQNHLLLQPWSSEAEKAEYNTWYTWRHEMAVKCIKDRLFPTSLAYRFDPKLLEQSQHADEYLKCLRVKYGDAFQR